MVFSPLGPIPPVSESLVEPTPSSSPATGRVDRATLLALLDASRAISEALEPAEAFRLVSEHASRVLRAESASVLLHDAARDELVFQTVIDKSSSEAVEGFRFPASEGIAGQVFRSRRSVRVDDARQNRNFLSDVDKLAETRTRAIMAVPLIYRDAPLGVIEVINPTDGGTFSQDDLELLELFANLVAPSAQKTQRIERLHRENTVLRESMPAANFIGRSDAFAQVLAMCQKVAPTTTTVLLTGETGTGKEMAARAIHQMSPRESGPFVAVNCAALPESLIESELFGHEAGAFSGATSRKPGRFELADGGTLLLDEIGELDQPMQAKLLRVLENREFTTVGGTVSIPCDVRIVAATNRDLRAESDAGRFREDLYYRLNVFPIALPPLRDRSGDLPVLTEHLIAQLAPSMGVTAPTVSDSAMGCMLAYSWPGNVRELRNVVERAALLADDEILPSHLPPEVAKASAASPEVSEPRSALAEQEVKLVVAALEENDWNQSAAARQLGITRDILRYRVKRYGLKRPM